MTPAENEARWSWLINGLHTEVGAFAALPSAAAERADAAFCLFLHVLASRTMRISPAWPAAVAERLEIGKSGPANPIGGNSSVQFEPSDGTAQEAMAWHIDASPETGESGPAAGTWETTTEAAAESPEITAEEGVEATLEHNLPPADRPREEGHGR